MVKVFQGTNEEYAMDGYLHTNLLTAKDAVSKDMDMVIIIDGPEGSGKSVMTQQIAKVCYPKLTLNNIVFTPDTFKEAVLLSNKNDAVVYDEAYAGLSSRGAMSKVNRMIVKMLTEIRQKNLYIFIVLPTFFDLDKYVALWRSRALIHVYMHDGFERGYFAFYNIDKKKDLYVEGKKFYSYSKPHPNFIGRFANHYVVDEQEYRSKKLAATTILEDDNRVYLSKKARELKQDMALNLENIKQKLGLNEQQIADIMGVTTMTLYNYRKKYQIKDELKELPSETQGF